MKTNDLGLPVVGSVNNLYLMTVSDAENRLVDILEIRPSQYEKIFILANPS